MYTLNNVLLTLCKLYLFLSLTYGFLTFLCDEMQQEEFPEIDNKDFLIVIPHFFLYSGLMVLERQKAAKEILICIQKGKELRFNYEKYKILELAAEHMFLKREL